MDMAAATRCGLAFFPATMNEALLLSPALSFVVTQTEHPSAENQNSHVLTSPLPATDESHEANDGARS